MLTSDLIAKFNAVSGNNVPLNPSQGPSRADQIRALGQSSQPTTQPGFLSRVASDIGSRVQNVKSDVQSEPNTLKGNAMGIANTAGQIGGGINDIIGEGIKAVAPGIPKLIQQVAQSPVGQGIAQRYQDYVKANPDKAKLLEDAFNVIGASTAVEGGVEGVGKLADVAPQLGKEAVQAGSDLKSSVGNVISKAKEAISPTLTPEEATGKIIQGKIGDIPAAQRTFSSLPSDTGDITKMSPKDLSEKVGTHIQNNLKEVDTHFANDTTPHTMEDFERTTGKGANAVKTNYVQQAMDQLKMFYEKTNDASGLSDIKSLEEKANTVGLTSQELNDLAKEHGSAIKAFNANGEAASGLTKQAAENTRAGVKATARETLAQTDPEAAKEAARLDKETSDAIKTKKLLDKQVESENKGVQKNGKQGKIAKAYKTIKEHPVKSAIAGYIADKTIKKVTGIGF